MSIEKLRKKYMEYLDAINNIGFASSEYDSLPKNPVDDEELIDAVSSIIDTSKELNLIVEQSPSSIYVADIDGKTLRINYTFEATTGLSREALLGRTTSSIEKDDIFQPSVCSIALKEKRRVILPQVVNKDREFVVAGVPIID